MESIFIDPSALPGGRSWATACEKIISSHVQVADGGDLISPAAEALGCYVSPISGFCQILLLLAVYGGILYKASCLIADGSELLLLVPSLRHIVGSVVLPVLGAVPDGAIVLFSALGPNAQEQLSVGVGALAGSTSMLLTLPWFLSIVAGRVNIRRADGVLTYYQRPHKLDRPDNYDPDFTGVEPMPMVKISGRIMLLTSISYVVIQGAALVSGTFFQVNDTADSIASAAELEYWPAIICLVFSTGFFFWYLYDQVTSTSPEEKEYQDSRVDEVKRKQIIEGQVTLTAAFQEIWCASIDVANPDEGTGLVDQQKKDRLNALLKTFFHAYDLDNNHNIDRMELGNLMRDMGEVLSKDELEEMFKNLDTNQDGQIEYDEFVEYMPTFMTNRANKRYDVTEVVTSNEENLLGGADIEEDEDEEEVPEGLRHIDPETQIRNVMYRSFTMMAIGTTLVLIFSDPMVGVLSDVGSRLGIQPFYVSFVLAPLASNASELLAAFSYAQKKTRKSVTISFSTLLGAAIMNNTFVLAIFMLLLTIKGLAWTFTAETISILFVEVIMALMSQKKVLTLRDGFHVILLYPLCLIIVAFLQNVVGLD